MIELGNILTFTKIIAAAGGGGSSSGGSGSSGGGGAIVLLYLMAFLGAETFSARYRKRYLKTNDSDAFTVDQLKVWSVAAGVIMLLITMWLVSDFTFIIFFIPMVLGVIFGVGDGLYGWFDKIKPNKKARQQLTKAATGDSAWNQEYIKQGVTNVFNQYQNDWSKFNLESCKSYMTPRYFEHVNLMLTAFKQMNRQNTVWVRSLDQIEITDVIDSTNDTQDRFVAGISATIQDVLYESKTNRFLYNSTDELAEYWHFVRNGNSWLLDGITPHTATNSVREKQIEQFATKAGAFYSLDWGRMLIPTRGQLFRRGSIISSDINNHVIGRLYDTGRTYADGLIYQIYTYSTEGANDSSLIYLIGQITVPKYYGNILIRRKKWLNPTPKGMVKVSLEWMDFNNKFCVYAERVEQVTSFELLNPQMMQWLESAPFEINLEVIDNSIYFYVNKGKITVDNYSTMLAILQAAYRELKM